MSAWGTSIEAARIEIAKVCHVEVISISEWPSHPGALSSKKMTREEIEKWMDELARRVSRRAFDLAP
jgi:hypothetical protein